MTFSNLNCFQKSKFKAFKMVKTAFFDLLKSAKWFHVKSEWQKNVLHFYRISTVKNPNQSAQVCTVYYIIHRMSKVFSQSSWNQLRNVGNTDLPWLVEILPLCEEKNKLLYISIQVCLAHCIKLISCLIHIRQNSKNQKVYSINL